MNLTTPSSDFHSSFLSLQCKNSTWMQQGHEEGGMQCGEKFERHSGNKNAKDEEISGHK